MSRRGLLHSRAFFLYLNLLSTSIAQGGSATLATTTDRTGGYTGAVTIAVEGAPDGVTTSLGAFTLTGTTLTAPLTIQVAGSTTPGVYPLTVRATAAGVRDSPNLLTLTVTAPGALAPAAAAPAGSRP